MATNVPLDVASRILNVLQRGVTQGAKTGTGATTARQANTTNWNAAIAECISQGKLLYNPPGYYEISGALVINGDGFRWLGTWNTKIVQFVLNTAVIHVGAANGTFQASNVNIVIDGANLQYNGTATAGGNALELSGIYMSRFCNMQIGDFADLASAFSLPYNAIWFDEASGTTPCFSNTFQDIRCHHFTHIGLSMWRVDYSAMTQNVFINVYLIGGSGSGQRDLSGTSGAMPVYLGSSLGQCFYGLNIEWTKFSRAMHVESANGCTIMGLNLEGCSLKFPSSSDGGFFEIYSADLAVLGGTVNGCYIQAANNVNNGSIFYMGPQSSLTIDRFYPQLCTNDTSNYSIIHNWTSSGDFTERVQLGHLALGNSDGLNYIETYAFGSGSDGGLFGQLSDFNCRTPYNYGNQNVTHYAYQTAGILRFAPSGGNKTCTLSNQCASGIGAKLPRGVHRRIFVLAGSASSQVVANGGTGGGTLATVTAGTGVDVVYDGTNWVLT